MRSLTSVCSFYRGPSEARWAAGRDPTSSIDERRKIHDLLIEGVELALKKRGFPTLAEMKAKWERKKP